MELEKTWRSIPSGKIRCEGHRLVPFQRRKYDSMPYRLPYLLKSGWELFHLQHRRTFHTLALPPLFKRFFNPAHPFKCFSWFSRSSLCQRDPLSFSLRSFCHFSGRSCCAGSLRHRWCGHVIHNKWPGFYFPLNLRDSHSIYIWTVISQSLTHTHTHTHTLCKSPTSIVYSGTGFESESMTHCGYQWHCMSNFNVRQVWLDL